MKKQFLCGILTTFLMVCLLPVSALATTTYNYNFYIETRNVTNAGTDSEVHAGFVFHDYGTYSAEMDSSANDFEKGDVRDYSLSSNTGDPWMIKQVYIDSDGKGTASGWYPGAVRVTMPLISGSGGSNVVSVDFSGELIDGNSATRDCYEQTKRIISSWGGFDDWGSTGALNNDSSVSLVRTWDNMITDQYGTYNPWGYNDAPTLTCTPSNAALTGYTFTTGSVSSPASFNLDYRTAYQQMVSAGIEEVTFSFELTFPERTAKTTDGYTNLHSETITVSRAAIAAHLANADIAAAQALIPVSFTADEGTTTNLRTYLNGLTGMSATGTTLTLESANANVAADGTISYTGRAVTGNVTVRINKTNGTEVSQIIAVTVPAHTTPAQRANAAIAAAQALIPASFTAVEGTTTNLRTYLNGLTGMGATGTTLTLESANANVAADGTISYTGRAVTGNVTVKINKTDGTEVSKNIAVTVAPHVQRISGDYVLIFNESLTAAQPSGIISFDDTIVSESAMSMQSLSDNAAMYQQIDDADVPGVRHTQAVTAYSLGATKTLSGPTFTLRGIGEHCYIWMDDTTYNNYAAAGTLAAAVADIINVYDTGSYPVLQKLGAATMMNYADGSGKLSIFLENGSSTASGYFSPGDMTNYSITGIHIPLASAERYFEGYGALLAHEGQHALNASTQKFTIWLNEGLSAAAMDMYYDGQDGLGWLAACMQNPDAKSGAVGLAHTNYTSSWEANYSIPMLFLRYLNAQANNGFDHDSDFYSRFYTAASSGTGLLKDAYIIEQVLQQYASFKNEDGTYWSMAQAAENFRIAAFKQDAAGKYGFYGDSVVRTKLGGPALYVGTSGKSIKIQPTGGIIVKTNNGVFEVPYDAGADMKFISFSVSGALPTNQADALILGGNINTTIYNDRPITFENIRVLKTDANGNYTKVYRNLAELYADGYSLLAIRGYGSANQSTYTLGTNPNGTIMNGDGLYIRQGTGVINSNSDWTLPRVYIGTAKVKNVYVDPQCFFTVLNTANNSLLEFLNDPDNPWLGNIAGNYVSSDIAGLSSVSTLFTGTISMPRGATANLTFDWKVSCEQGYDGLCFFLNGALQNSGVTGTANAWTSINIALSGGSAGQDYTFTWKYIKDSSGNAGEDTAYVRNIAITNLAQQLQSITTPNAITGVANGTAKTPEALGLPSTVTLVTGAGNVSASVTWDVASSSYNAATKTQQTFTVNGTVTLPGGVVNTGNVALNTSISVTVNAANQLDECFIATAAFGSKFTWPVALLRHFRDEYLLTNSLGKAFVTFYYHNSPPIAAIIADSQPLKILVRILLAPVIAIVYVMYHPMLTVPALVLLGIFLIFQYRLRRRYAQV